MQPLKSTTLHVLQEFFSLKFFNSDRDLFKKVRQQLYQLHTLGLKEIISTLEANRQNTDVVLNEDFQFIGSSLERISVIVPTQLGEDAIWNALMASAIFPWELDPKNKETYLEDLCQEHVLMQLAYSSYLKHPFASNLIRNAASMSVNLDASHSIFHKKNLLPPTEYRCYVIETPLLKDYPNFEAHTSTVFDIPEMGEDVVTEGFNKLLAIEQHGVVLEESETSTNFPKFLDNQDTNLPIFNTQEQKIQEKEDRLIQSFNQANIGQNPPKKPLKPFSKIQIEVPKKAHETISYTINVVGNEPIQSLIWHKLKSRINLDNFSDENAVQFSGTYLFKEIKCQPIHFIITASIREAKQDQNGIIFTDPREDSEAVSNQYEKTSSFLFINTERPSMITTDASLFYMYNEDIFTTGGDYSLEVFLQESTW